MIWTAFQIAVSTSIGNMMDTIVDPIPYVIGAAVIDVVTGNTLSNIGRVLHYPEEVMYRTIGYALEQTTEVVDEVNETGLNLLDRVYTRIYDM